MAKVAIKLKGKKTPVQEKREQIASDMATLKNANAAQQKEILGRVLALLDELIQAK